MKHTLRLTALLAALLLFAACEKNDIIHERDIVYTVDGERHEVHLKNDTEFDALLDRFCDYAEGGSRVSFQNVDRLTRKGTKEAVSYSTTNREEMKRWMRQMEDQGKTVTVTYDRSTGTYNGAAYANASPQYGCFSGVLTIVPTPIMHSGVNEPAMVVALQISADSTLIISWDGQFGDGQYGECIWRHPEDDPDSLIIYMEGDTITLCGTLMTVLDYNGNPFLALEIGGGDGPSPAPVPNPNGELLTYECDMMPAFSYIISFDTTNHRVYISLHDSTYMPNVPIGSGLPLGIYDYSPSGTVNTYMLTDGMGETTGPYLFQFSGGFCGNTLTFNTSDMSHPITLVRTYKWTTYLCLDMNLDIVMHAAHNDSEWEQSHRIDGQFASNIVPRVNCQTRLIYGRCLLDRPEWSPSYAGTPTYTLWIYQPINDTNNYWLDGLTIEGEPTTDHHFTIRNTSPYSYCTDTYNFYRP